MIIDPIYAPLSFMACYLVLAIAMLVTRRVKGKAGRNLLVYLLALAAWNASVALSLAVPDNTLLYAIGGQAALGGLVILAVVFLLLGPKQLPKLAKSMGKALREFKKEFESAGKKKK